MNVNAVRVRVRSYARLTSGIRIQYEVLLVTLVSVLLCVYVKVRTARQC